MTVEHESEWANARSGGVAKVAVTFTATRDPWAVWPEDIHDPELGGLPYWDLGKIATWCFPKLPQSGRIRIRVEMEQLEPRKPYTEPDKKCRRSVLKTPKTKARRPQAKKRKPAKRKLRK